MRILPGLAVLLVFQLAGEAVVPLLPIPIPGPVVGMALLWIALLVGVVKLEWVKGAADALLSRLGLFFVPAGVGVMAHTALLRREWLPIAAAIAVSTVAVLAVTGWTERWVARRRSPRGA
jgi:holin-like protein